MDSREFAGLELAATENVKFNGRFWTVQSGSKQYRVNAEVTFCTCESFELIDDDCKHMKAVRFIKARNLGTPLPVPADPAERAEMRPKRKTYPQNWTAYNQAQTTEKATFLRLLADLCSTIPEPERPEGKSGRKPIPLRDAIFATVAKIHSGFSSRRFMTDLRETEEDGYIAATPHFNTTTRTLDRESTTSILRELIVRSSLPLSAIESVVAIDSSGFSSNKFARWFDTKHGKERRESVWVKCHIACGVRTNIVTAVELGNEHDSQWFRELLRTTAQNFAVKEVVADKAYLSREILEEVNRIGGVAYIPFKSNNQPDTNGEVWKSLFHFFHLHREEFLRHYHQRSNVESTFSMIKRKFGDSVRARTETGQRNETLAKLLCHNIVVLVHEMHELGIDPTFGEKHVESEPDDDEPRILRFPGA